MVAVVKMVVVLSVSILLYGCAGMEIFKASSTQVSHNSDVEKGMSPGLSTEVHCTKTGSGQKFFVMTDSADKRLPRVKVGATGYGAPPKNYYPEGQRRLMTMRASKVDAYRALAEVVGGLHIWGGSAIGDMVLERDRYRSFVDTYVRGARVVSVNPMADGTYSTVVEMEVNQHFLSQVMAFVDPAANINCDDNVGDSAFTFYGANGNNPSFYYSE